MNSSWFTLQTNFKNILTNIFKNYPSLYEAINVGDIKVKGLQRNELKYA